MDNLVAWIKNNQAKAAAIGVLLAALAYTQLASKPRTLADCLLKVSQEAMNDQAAKVGNVACRMKFKKPKEDQKLFGESVNPYLSDPYLNLDKKKLIAALSVVLIANQASASDHLK